ncbi:MAG TPA: F0F1 ATP synthase subunit B [Bacillota bacterium]|nr:F0F1 ATP synthase subunit B [Bacillota bacterium]
MEMEIKVNLGTLIVMVINFIILMVVLIRLLYRPIQGILEQRRQKIAKDLDDAKNTKEKAEQLQHQARIVLEEAHVEAYEIVERSKNEADRLREELFNQVTHEVDQLRRRTQLEIERSKQIARDEARNEAVHLALMAVSKIIGTHMTQDLDATLIRKVLADLDKEATT